MFDRSEQSKIKSIQKLSSLNLDDAKKLFELLNKDLHNPLVSDANRCRNQIKYSKQFNVSVDYVSSMSRMISGELRSLVQKRK